MMHKYNINLYRVFLSGGQKASFESCQIIEVNVPNRQQKVQIFGTYFSEGTLFSQICVRGMFETHNIYALRSISIIFSIV